MIISQIDAFADRPFTGNPAAVCMPADSRSDEWMQLVAREMNLSETAYLTRRDDGFGLRWFTPAVEVELCGHATLASAHFLWEEGHLEPGQVARFHTRSGLLTARRDGEWIELDFPARPASPHSLPEGLTEALGVEPVWTGRNEYDYLVEVESPEIVRLLVPDHSALRSFPVRGVMVTARSENGDYDFISRFFAPGSGIDEDPVTGSAHCCLAPYWAAKLERREMIGYQASARGGTVRTRLQGERVLLAGRAVTVLRGELMTQ